MSFLDNILGAVIQPLQDTGTGLAAIGQSMESRRDPQRRPRPSYTPEQERQIQILSDFAARGASPDLVMSLFGQIEGDLEQRMAAFQQRNQMRREGVLNRPGYAMQALEMSQAGMDPSAIGAAFQGVPGAGGYIQNQVVPTLGGGAPTSSGLTPEAYPQIDADVTALNEQGVDLGGIRRILMEPMRADPATTSQEIEEAYNRIGTVYQALNPGMAEYGAPIRMQTPEPAPLSPMTSQPPAPPPMNPMTGQPLGVTERSHINPLTGAPMPEGGGSLSGLLESIFGGGTSTEGRINPMTGRPF